MTGIERFEGKVAFVTGGGGAIGSATAERLGLEGARVALVDVNRDAAEAQAARLRDLGVDATAVEADLVSDSGAESAVLRTQEIYGPIEVAAQLPLWGIPARKRTGGVDGDQIEPVVDSFGSRLTTYHH